MDRLPSLHECESRPRPLALQVKGKMKVWVDENDDWEVRRFYGDKCKSKVVVCTATHFYTIWMDHDGDFEGINVGELCVVDGVAFLVVPRGVPAYRFVRRGTLDMESIWTAYETAADRGFLYADTKPDNFAWIAGDDGVRDVKFIDVECSDTFKDPLKTTCAAARAMCSIHMLVMFKYCVDVMKAPCGEKEKRVLWRIVDDARKYGKGDVDFTEVFDADSPNRRMFDFLSLVTFMRFFWIDATLETTAVTFCPIWNIVENLSGAVSMSDVAKEVVRYVCEHDNVAVVDALDFKTKGGYRRVSECYSDDVRTACIEVTTFKTSFTVSVNSCV